jgi:release factor glutamine methyltransferase
MPSIREKYFELKKIKSPYLNENVIRALLMHANDIRSPLDLTLNMEKECKNCAKLDEMIENIVSGVPYQYVINESIFNEVSFYVDNRVLIPRNETEELFQRTVKLINELHLENKTYLDFCTGSGVLGISLKLNYPQSEVYVSDISKDALDVVKINMNRLITNVEIIESDMLNNVLSLNKKFDVLISNPPYIPSKDTVDKQVLEYEPHLALFANPDTRFYEEVFKHYKELMNEKSLLAFEIGEDMEESLILLIKKYFINVKYTFEKDIYNKTRFLFIINE